MAIDGIGIRTAELGQTVDEHAMFAADFEGWARTERSKGCPACELGALVGLSRRRPSGGGPEPLPPKSTNPLVVACPARRITFDLLVEHEPGVPRDAISLQKK